MPDTPIAAPQFQTLEQMRLLSLVSDKTDSAVIITNGAGRILYVNSGFNRMFGHPVDSVLGQTPYQVIAPHLEQSAIDAMQQQLLAGLSLHTEELTCSHNGQRIWCSVTSNPVLDEQGQLLNTISILTDITDSKIHQVLQHKVLEAMLRELPLENVMDLLCQEVERIAPEVIASILRVDEQGRLHPLAAPRLPDSYCQALEGLAIGPTVGSCGTAAFRQEAVLVSDIATDPLWHDYKALALPLGLHACWSTPLKSSGGRVIGTFAFYYREPRAPSPLHRHLVDVSTHLCTLALEREDTRQQMRQLAFHDSLTGLANRSLLQARAEQAIAEIARSRGALTVLFIDLDRFKQVNDSLGHPAGDELLRLVAQRLTHNRRASDIVGRLSGDEFLMVLPHCDSNQVTDLLELLMAHLTAPCLIEGVSLTPSASIGISLYPGDGLDLETLLRHADMAMYQAKANGRGCFSFFSHEMNQLAQERMTLETALREALAADRLHLYYQPQIRFADGQLHGVEALARWHHPVFGDISPARFIPLAQECGLIGELGHWALREACRQLASWRQRGLSIPSISVNLSPTNFHDLELPRMIGDTLQQHGLAAQDLTLEVTEGVLLDVNPSTLNILNQVHALGVRLAMDDFGTGYSSLSYLRSLPVSELKLDKSFVDDLAQDRSGRALSDAVIRIGESLNLTVVAEGIESDAQYRILKEQGYHVAQGYLLSRPLPAGELEAWLKNPPQRA